MIKLKEMIKKLPEINDKWKIHDSGKGENRQKYIKRIRPGKQIEIESKPDGFWYGFGTSWLEWCQSEEPNWIGGGLYLLESTNSKILKIKTERSLLDFTINYGANKYTGERVQGSGKEFMFDSFESVKVNHRYISGDTISPSTVSINWNEVVKKYDGIEINPMQYRLRLMALNWYYGWDVASGCIWRPSNVKLKKIGEKLQLFPRYTEILK